MNSCKSCVVSEGFPFLRIARLRFIQSAACWLVLTSPVSFASNLVLEPSESGHLVPKPFRGGHGFRIEFAEQTGMFLIEDLNSAGAAETVAMLDFDGTILGEPSWIIKFATSSGLYNLNAAFGDLVLPPGVGPDGSVDSAHNTVPSGGSIWSWDSITVTQDPGGSWVNVPGGIFHTSSAPPFPTDPPALVAFTNQTGGRVDIHSIVPEPSSAMLAVVGIVVVLGAVAQGNRWLGKRRRRSPRQ